MIKRILLLGVIMNKSKIIIFIITAVLIISFLPCTHANSEDESIKVSLNFGDSISDDLQGIIVLCIIEIENTGDTLLRDIDWTYNAKEESGRIVFGDGEHGTIPTLEPGEKETIILLPFPRVLSFADGQSPIGFGNILMSSSVKTSTGASAEDQEKVFLLGFLLIPIDM